MEEGAFLFAIAQIGAVYVGFSTLIVVIVQQFTGPRGALEAIRLDSMLRMSLLTVVFSLLPYLPHHLELPGEVTWRISCLLLGAFWLMYYIHRVRWIRAPGHAEAVKYMTVVNHAAVLVIHPLGITAVFLGALGLWGQRVAFVYVSAILCILLMSANVFIELVKSLSAGKAE